MLLGESPNLFLGLPPEWTLSGVDVETLSGKAVTVSQQPFQWLGGVWEADVVVTADECPTDLPQRIMVRVSPDTLRRWKEAGIDSLREARAQLQEHLLRRLSIGELSLLTFL